MNDATNPDAKLDEPALRMIAAEAYDAFNSGGRHVQSFSARHPGFTLDEAYRVTAFAHALRVAHGYKPVGRKIGFTNRAMWVEHGVHAPIWGYVFDRTVRALAEIDSLKAVAADLNQDSRGTLWLLAHTYSALLARIESLDFGVFRERVRISRAEKMLFIARARFGRLTEENIIEKRDRDRRRPGGPGQRRRAG